MVDQISFKANYISPSKIQRISKGKGVESIGAAFVELSPHSAQDRRLMQEVACMWHGQDSFAGEIFDTMNTLHYLNMTKNPDISDSKRFFALTLQGDSFEKLDSDYIFGVAQVSEISPKRVAIDYFQAISKNHILDQNSIFNRAGTALLDSLKQHYKTRTLVVESVEEAKPFYEFNGFESSPKGSCSYVFRA